MSPELKQFIQNNKNLINENSKESWEEIYSRLSYNTRGEFTEAILSIGIDPAKILKYIPSYYLYRSNIKGYVIPNNIANIGQGAFYKCSNLTSIEIPDSVTSIYNHAFSNCSKLTRVKIGDSVTNIGYGVFSNCVSLTSVVIGDSVTSIGDSAFYMCENLTSVVIPVSVTTINDKGFSFCANLTSVVIPDSVTVVGKKVFTYCKNLKEIQYEGTKKNALTKLKVKNKSWREGSSIEKIVCIDGEINLN